MELAKGAKTQLELSSILHLSTSNVAKNMTEFKQKDLVKCKNPEDRSFRFYELTEEGKKIFVEINKILRIINHKK